MNDLQKVQLTLRNRWFLNFFSRLDNTLTRTILRQGGSLRTPSIHRSNCYPFDLSCVRSTSNDLERERASDRASELERDRACATLLHTHRNNASRYPSPHPSSLSLSLVWFFPPPFARLLRPCSVTLFASHGREGQVETLGITKGPVVPLCISIECGRLSWFLSTWGPGQQPL